MKRKNDRRCQGRTASAVVLLSVLLTLTGCGDRREPEEEDASILDQVHLTSEGRLDALLRETFDTGVLDDKVLSALKKNTPKECDPAERPMGSRETYTSEFTESYEDIETEGLKTLTNWEYPTKFREEREEMFRLLAEIDVTELETDEEGCVITSGLIPVESCGYGAYQRRRPDVTGVSSLYYYGDTSGNRPDGAGVILCDLTQYSMGLSTTHLLIPSYAGHFKEGMICGYGIKFCGEEQDYEDGFVHHPVHLWGIQAEGNFDFSDEDPKIGLYHDLNGPGILYYSNFEKKENGDIIRDLIEMLESQPCDFDGIILTNYLVPRPRVVYDATFEDGCLIAGDQYYFGDSCYGKLRYSGDFGDDNMNRGTSWEPDGRVLSGMFAQYPTCDFLDIPIMGGVYAPSGKLEFVGIFSRDPYSDDNQIIYSDGWYYDENGELMGTYSHQEFTWAD